MLLFIEGFIDLGTEHDRTTRAKRVHMLYNFIVVDSKEDMRQRVWIERQLSGLERTVKEFEKDVDRDDVRALQMRSVLSEISST